MKAADLLVRALAAAGDTRIFSLSGNQIMPIYDACFEAGIEIIHTRHEAAAVFMAEAYAQLTGEVAVAMVTAGPGMANAIGPLFACSESQTPVLLLTGDSASGQDGRGAFQELDQVRMTAPVTRLSFRVARSLDIGTDAARAIRTAQSGRPGPVHMALPFDLVNAEVPDGSVPAPHAFAREKAPLDPADMHWILRTLAAAERPLVICGPVLNESRSEGRLRALSDAINVPVVAMESPRGLNDPALGRFAQALARADVVLTLGKRIDFTLNFGKADLFDPSCQWIVIEADAGERSRAHSNLNGRLTACLAADPRDVADAMISAGSGNRQCSEWRHEVSALIAARSHGEAAQAESGKITPAQLCAAVQRQVDKAGNATLVCDGGEFGQWAQAGTKSERRIINGISGAIGGGLCYALGAKKARPDTLTFALMGDGTVGFHFAEFETAVRTDTPFVVVIGNDERWNAEHLIQIRDYGAERLIGCELSGARYDEAVKGLGGHGEYVTELADLDDALDRAVKSGKVACVNVIIEGIPAPTEPRQ